MLTIKGLAPCTDQHPLRLTCLLRECLLAITAWAAMANCKLLEQPSDTLHENNGVPCLLATPADPCVHWHKRAMPLLISFAMEDSSPESGHCQQGFIQAVRGKRGQGLSRERGPRPLGDHSEARYIQPFSPWCGGADSYEGTPATNVIPCPLKFSRFIWQKHPHPPVGTWHRPEFPACVPALGEDIKIALCKGWLKPERRAPKATQKNQEVVAASSYYFNYRLWQKPGHPGASAFHSLAVPVILNGLCDPLRVHP